MKIPKTYLLIIVIIAFNLPACRKPGLESLPDIILITIDTLRPDHLAVYGYERRTAPFISSIADRGYIFDNCYATSSWTAPSMASLFTGIYPRGHGVLHGFVGAGKIVNQEKLDSSLPTLAELLKSRGYHTFGISTNGHVTPETGMARGFDEFVSLWFRDAEEAHQASLDLKEKVKNSRPYFFWIHYFDPHAPYRFRRPWIEGYSSDPVSARKWAEENMKELRRKRAIVTSDPKNRSALVDLYDSEINYTDEFLRRLFDEVLSPQSCLIIITSDHGEGFLEHGLLGHGNSLFEEVVKVPLIVKMPEEEERPVNISAPVSIVDVVPSVLDFLGISVPELVQGKSFLSLMNNSSPMKPRPIFCELDRGRHLKSIRRGRWKLIRKSGKKRAGLLYDLKADSAEENDVSGENQKVAGLLHRALISWQKQTPSFKAPRGEFVSKGEEKEVLKSLGYLH